MISFRLKSGDKLYYESNGNIREGEVYSTDIYSVSVYWNTTSRPRTYPEYIDSPYRYDREDSLFWSRVVIICNTESI